MQVFGEIVMGCINGRTLLTDEDMNYIARNTAMDRQAVEVGGSHTRLLGLVWFGSNFRNNSPSILRILNFRTFPPDFLKAMCVAQTKCPAKIYLSMKMCRKEHITQKK